MLLSERLDEAELAIALEAPGWWEAGAPDLADLAHLDAVLAFPEDHRARALLGLVAASGAPEPPEVSETVREASFEALCQAIPLSFLARDLALGALSASLPGGVPGSEALLDALARGPALRADTSEADVGPPVRVLLARPSDAEQVNLVLHDGVTTLEWWSSASALPDRCVVIAADGGPRTELEALARSEGRPEVRSRRWRLDVPAGDGVGFRFSWGSGRLAEVPLALSSGD
jgi:hypothetical protein